MSTQKRDPSNTSNTSKIAADAEAVLTALRVQGGSLRVEGTELRVVAPKGLSSDLLAALRQLKPDLIRRLTRGDGPKPHQDEINACGGRVEEASSLANRQMALVDRLQRGEKILDTMRRQGQERTREFNRAEFHWINLLTEYESVSRRLERVTRDRPLSKAEVQP